MTNQESTPSIVTVDNVYQAVSAVSNEIGQVMRQASTGGGVSYATLREDAVLAALHPLLQKYQLIIWPFEVADITRGTIPTSTGSMQYTMLKVGYRIAHVASDTFLECEAIGEGADVGGMSAAKAQTSAMKMMMRQAFRIRVDQAGNSGRGAPGGAQGGQRGQNRGTGAAPAQEPQEDNLSEFWREVKRLGRTPADAYSVAGTQDFSKKTRGELLEIYQDLGGGVT